MVHCAWNMDCSPILLALVRPSDHRRKAISAEADAAACDVHFADTLQAALLGLAARRPVAVIVDLELPESAALCEAVRSRRREVDIAVFGLLDRVVSEAFAAALRDGADDVVAFGADGALSARIVALPANSSVVPTRQGEALVIVADQAFGRRVARVLANAGYDVEHANDEGTLRRESVRQKLKLVVADNQLGPVRPIIEQARNRGNTAAWVVSVSADQINMTEAQLRGLPSVAVVNAADPADNVLFVSNEIANTSRSDSRVEPRLLYGTLAAFRSKGAEVDDYGYTYNISPAGVYVRTLAPPLESAAWIELNLPGTARRVRLEGEVIWRRSYGKLDSATAPPGFAIRITGGLSGDRKAWQRGCVLLAECQRAGLVLESTTEGPPSTPVPPPQFASAHSEPGQASEQSASGGTAQTTDAGAAQPTETATAQSDHPDMPGSDQATEMPSAGPPAPLVEARSQSGDTPSLGLLSPSVPSVRRVPTQDSRLSPTPAVPTRSEQAWDRRPARRATRPIQKSTTTERTGRSVWLGAAMGLGLGAAVGWTLLQPGTPSPLVQREPDHSEAALLSSGAAELSSSSSPAHDVELSSAPPATATLPLSVAGYGSASVGSAPLMAGPPPPHTTPRVGNPTSAPSAKPDPSAKPFNPREAEGPALAALQFGLPASTGLASQKAVTRPTPRGLPGHPQRLKPFEGYLRVMSSAKTQVFSQGVVSGRTNRWLRVSCGQRSVQLGDGRDNWRSPAVTVNVVCRGATEVAIQPSSP
ncbi:hypothetical protein ACFL5O_03190 [Myxococcota bacterium]